jgi:ABC-type transport system substrate-binding protein
MKLIKMMVVLCLAISNFAGANVLRVSFQVNPTSLDNAKVNSAAEFRILLELTSSLIDFDGADIKGDIAKSWVISTDKKRFEFTIEENRKFSDGSTITIDDVVASIKRSVESKYGIHYDVEKIVKIEKMDRKSMVIVLKEPDPFFIQDLSNSEFAILSKEDQKAATGQQKFAVTSGPLFIKSFSKDSIQFGRNTSYPLYNSKQHESIVMEGYMKEDREKTFQNLLDKNLDYFWAPTISVEQHKKLLAAGYSHYPTRNSYTYWITFNLKSPIFSEEKNRQAVQKIFRENKIDLSDRVPKMQNTDQLYHPLGRGRLSADELDSIYSKLPRENHLKGKTVRILTSQNAFYNDRVCETLKKSSIDCVLVPFSGLDGFAKALESPEKFDAYIMNNDFSSDYLKKSLEIALYEKRPLIMVSKSDKEFQETLDKSLKSTDLDEIAKFQKSVGRLMLERAYIVPLFYDTRIVYAKASLNTSKWSTLTPDYAVWKIEK